MQEALKRMTHEDTREERDVNRCGQWISRLSEIVEMKSLVQKEIDESVDGEVEVKRFKLESLERKERVLRYLVENLNGEDLIKEPMAEGCGVAVVIPSYAERAYFLRTLDSLAGQEGVDKGDFEVLIVVNNPGEAPGRDAKENDEDYKRKIELFERAQSENQEVLRILDSLRKGEVPDCLDEEEAEIFNWIRLSGLRVFAIDKSSPGKNLPKGEANVGGARNRGVAEAVARFYEAGKNGIIAQTDSDTRLDKAYVKNLLDVFGKRPELVGLAGSLEFESQEDTELSHKVSLYSEAVYAYDRLLSALKEKIEGRNRIVEAKDIHFSGANMASRAYEAALVGGVPKIGGGEDPEFGRRLSKIGKIDSVPEVKVTTADRLSARTAVWAGHGQQKFKYLDKIEREQSIDVEPIDKVEARNRVFKNVFNAFRQRDFSVERLRRELSLDGKPLLDDEDLAALGNKLSKMNNLNQIPEDKDMIAISERLSTRLSEFIPNVPVEQAVPMILERFNEDGVLKERYEAILHDMIQTAENRVARAERAIDALARIFMSNGTTLTEVSFPGLVRANEEEIGVGQTDLERLKKDPELIRKFVAALNGSKSVDDAKARLKKSFRRSFDGLGSTLERQVLELRAMRQARRELEKRG